MKRHKLINLCTVTTPSFNHRTFQNDCRSRWHGWYDSPLTFRTKAEIGCQLW